MFFVMSLRLYDWLIENNISIMDETCTTARAIWNFQEGKFGTHNKKHDMPAICEQYDAKTQCKGKKTLVQ